MTQEVSGVSSGLWVAIATVATVLGFLAGYALSARTGVEPGYFLKAEAGGYGVPPKAATEGMSEELRKHYESLAK
ncbi:MAG: hypothetical protein OEM83_08425 [Gammaproteobacteria bacterium]|nr:hypothetical protein [Gammaproteobacteria bacterium]MDH5512327.1 hypothetical protein [Gammaproteobacteria bacterium]